MTTAAEKEELKRILEGRRRAAKRKSSSRFLIYTIGTGYAAMAIFTTAALAFSAYSLGSITKTARNITYQDLPAVGNLTKLRFSLLAQERFAGKYAILRDPAFMDLYRQREQESLATLRALEGTGSAQESAELARRYREYQEASRQLFAGGNPSEQRTKATELLATIDTLYARRQAGLHKAIEEADRQRRRTVWWTVGISLAGFLLTVWVAPLVTRRIFRGARKLQVAAHQALAGDFRMDAGIAAGCEEIQDLAEDVAKLAGKVAELEQLSFEPHRLSGDLPLEMILAERLKGGLFALCHLEIVDLKFFTVQYGYAAGCRLLRLAGALLQRTVAEQCRGGMILHAGGNCFMLLLSVGQEKAVSEEAVKSFAAEVAQEFAPVGAGAAGPGPCAASMAVSTFICGEGCLDSVAAIVAAVDARTGGTASPACPDSATEAATLTPE